MDLVIPLGAQSHGGITIQGPISYFDAAEIIILIDRCLKRPEKVIETWRWATEDKLGTIIFSNKITHQCMVSELCRNGLKKIKSYCHDHHLK